jgi:hypothetical protein
MLPRFTPEAMEAEIALLDLSVLVHGAGHEASAEWAVRD